MFHVDNAAQFLLLILLACIVCFFPFFLIVFVVIFIVRIIVRASSADKKSVSRPPLYLIYKSWIFKGIYWTIINFSPDGNLIIENEFGEIRTAVTIIDRPHLVDDAKAWELSKKCRAKYGEPCSTDIGIGSKLIGMHREE